MQNITSIEQNGFATYLNSRLRFIPVFLFCMLLIYPFVTFWLFPNHYIYLAFPFFLYFFYRSASFTYGLIGGFFAQKKENQIDWMQKIRQSHPGLSEDDLPNHLIAIPMNQENIAILDRLLDSLIKQTYPTQKIFVSVSIEEANFNDEEAQSILKKYQENFGDRISIKKHELIPNEVPGAASNRTNAFKQFLKTSTIDTSNTIATSPDVDTVFSNQYLARVAYEWLNSANRDSEFYQTAVYLPTNNFNSIPAFIRVLSVGLLLSILASSNYDGKNRFTFSCFSLSLKSLININFWDTTIAIDDTPFHWRAFAKLDGIWSCKVIYTPIYVDSIHGETKIKSLINQYWQYHRWGWGIITMAFAFLSVRKSNLKIHEKLFRAWKIFELFILLKIMPVILLIYFCIFSITKIDENTQLIKIISLGSNLNLITLLPILSIKFALTQEFYKYNKIKLIIYQTLEVPLGIINLLTFGFFPYLHAAFDLSLRQDHTKTIKWSEKRVSNYVEEY